MMGYKQPLSSHHPSSMASRLLLLPQSSAHLLTGRRIFPPPGLGFRSNGCGRTRDIACKAKNADTGGSEGGGSNTAEIAAGVAGLLSSPVIGISLYTLKMTGCGLPPGPGGSIGAVEGVSYLVVAGIVGWSLYTKAKTGSGLPAGPYGLLGAAEGVSYLTAVAIAVVFGIQFFEQGSLPGPLPSDKCFG